MVGFERIVTLNVVGVDQTPVQPTTVDTVLKYWVSVVDMVWGEGKEVLTPTADDCKYELAGKVATVDKQVGEV